MKASAVKMSESGDPRLEAARRRLRESAGQADTLEAVREIVTNLLGCEEVGLFHAKAAKNDLLWSYGIDPKRHGTLDAFDEPALHRVMQGEFHVTRADLEGKGEWTKPVRVFIPIRSGDQVVAVLVMVNLLPQKVDFDEADIKLAQVLSDEVGRALFSGSTHGGSTHAGA
jgi:hypothetical protein